MTQLEQQLADALLTHAINGVHDVQSTHARIESYRTLILAASNNYSWSTPKDVCCGETDPEPCCGQVCGNTDPEPCSQEIPAKEEPAPVEDKPKRVRRTKEQIAADEAAAAAEATLEQDTSTTLADMGDGYDGKMEKALAETEPEAAETQIDDVDVPDAELKITHGQVQELFTRKLTTIAQNKGDVNGFKARLRDVLTELGSPAGISKLPEANLAAFHAKLVNLV